MIIDIAVFMLTLMGILLGFSIKNVVYVRCLMNILCQIKTVLFIMNFILFYIILAVSFEIIMYFFPPSVYCYNILIKIYII